MTDLILKLGGIQALLLGVILLQKKNRTQANLILASLVICIGLSSVLHALEDVNVYLKYPHLMRVNWGLPLLFGPLLYLYTRTLTNSEKDFDESDLWNFTPYVLNILFLIPFLLKSGEEKIQTIDYFTAVISSGTDNYFFYYFLVQITSGIIGISYSRDGLKELRLFSTNLKQEFSSIEKLKIEWLKFLLWGFIFLSVSYAVASVVTFGDRYPQVNYLTYYYIIVFVFIYVLSYKALGTPHIVHWQNVETVALKVDQLKPRSKKELDTSNLLEYMSTHKPYLNGELTATKLAEQINLSRHDLSEMLNISVGMNFYDFINKYRIEEFKSRVGDSKFEHLTLLAIALDSGFNSKTSFNTIFKKSEGMTPTQYKNRMNH